MMRIGLGSVLAAGVALAACAPTSKNIVEVGEPQPFNPPPGEGGQAGGPPALEFPVLDIKGIVFSPNALDVPEMPGNGKTVKRSVADQRTRAGKAKGAAKANEGRDLALLLWYSTPAGEPKEIRKQVKAQREEALGVLKGLAADPAASEDILAAHAAALHAVGDAGEAAAAWDALVTKFPKSAKLERYKALRNYLALNAGQPLPHPLPAKLEGAPYEAVYVAAWERFRAGDGPAAIAAITAAAKGWTNLEMLTGIRRDVMLMYSRAGGNPNDAYALLEELVKKDKGDLARTVDALADAYAYAGEYEASAALREKLVSGAAPAKLAEIRLAQSLVHYRLLQPTEAADKALAAWAAAESAGDAGKDVREPVAKQIVNFGMIFHSEYATTHDARFVEPARKLYSAYAAIPGRADADKVKNELVPNLETTVKTYGEQAGGKSVGVLDQPTVQRHIASYLEQVGACYEAQLQGEPTLAVEGKLSFDIAADGKVSGAKLDGVAEGDKGGPAVAKCLAQRANAWTFPASGTTARVVYPLSFKPSTK